MKSNGLDRSEFLFNQEFFILAGNGMSLGFKNSSGRFRNALFFLLSWFWVVVMKILCPIFNFIQ